MNARELIERLSRLSAAQKELPIVVIGEEEYEVVIDIDTGKAPIKGKTEEVVYILT